FRTDDELYQQLRYYSGALQQSTSKFCRPRSVITREPGNAVARSSSQRHSRIRMYQYTHTEALLGTLEAKPMHAELAWQYRVPVHRCRSYLCGGAMFSA